MRFVLSVVIFLTALPAIAQDYNTVLDVPEGATLVNLSASERVEIEQDLLVANLRIEAEDSNPRTVQDTINKAMKKAISDAKKVESLKASTQQYNVYQYDRNRGRKGVAPDQVWKGQQGLMIKGKKADDVLELVKKLQESGFAMNGLSYQVSPDLLEDTRESLLEDALMKLQAKAKRIGETLGKNTIEMKQINVDMGGIPYQPHVMMRSDMAKMESASMSAPVAAPGESQVTLNVTAQALIK